MRALPAVGFVVLAGLAIPVTMHATAASDRQEARDAALSAARDEVSNLLNIDYRTAQRDLDRIVAGATGHVAEQFAAERAQLQLLAQSQSITTGTVLSAGLVRLDLPARVARVDVAADARVGDAQHQQPAVQRYRWVLTLLLEHGRWLVSDAALAGVPQ